LIKFY